MPTYEYECKKCEHRFEKFQRMTEPPVKRCPQCKGTVRRLMGTGAGIIFKGSGFYQTDYRSESYKKAAKSESSAPATPAASSSTSSASSSESKPAKKAD